MTNYQPGELLLVNFPFAHGGRGKHRPALVVADTGDNDVVLARVTTQSHNTAFDVRLLDWQAAGLKAPSVVRVHKMATINKALVQRSLGQLSPSDRKNAAAAAAQLIAGL